LDVTDAIFYLMFQKIDGNVVEAKVREIGEKE
jgi:hypothetical protein